MRRIVPILSLLVVAAGCAVGLEQVERSPTPPEEVLPVGSVAYLDDVGVYIVHDPELGVVAFDDHDPITDCALALREDTADSFFEDACNQSRYALNGVWLGGPSAYSLTPFDTYLGVDGNLYIEGEPQPRRDRLGYPIEDEVIQIRR